MSTLDNIRISPNHEGKHGNPRRLHLDQTFGYYTIVKKIGHGAEAEVYLCVDSRTQRGYVLRLASCVLRLAVNDDDN